MKKNIVLFFFLLITEFATAQPCTAPFPYAPVNGSNVSSLTPMLCYNWGSANLLYVIVYVATDSMFSNTVYFHSVPFPEGCYTLPSEILINNTWYWWKLKGTCSSGTYSSGVYNFFTSVTSIMNISTKAAEIFSLKQNFPNPFNPVTNIRFDIPSNLTGKFYQVKLSVFNTLGKIIQLLVNKRLNAGSYEVEFSGSRFASGMYFYKLEAGSFVETKRMILLK